KVTVGGKLFIKGFSSSTQEQIDIVKLYLSCVYNLAKHYNTFSPLNHLSVFHLLRIETLDGKKLDTPSHSYFSKHEEFSNVNFESCPIEKQPGVADFKEKLSFDVWTRNVMDVNLVIWIKDLPHCKVINKSYKLEKSKKLAISIVKIPNIKSSNKSYLEIIRTTKNVEKELIINNIFSIKDLNPFPFVDRNIVSDDSSYNEYSFLIKLEKYEIIMDRDNFKPSIEFEQVINDALESKKPYKALQGVFEEYGHFFAQKITLGRIFKKNIPNAATVKIDLKSPI
ncbi:13342_t:CDS:2, partial [Funneliformis geosporum]